MFPLLAALASNRPAYLGAPSHKGFSTMATKSTKPATKPAAHKVAASNSPANVAARSTKPAAAPAPAAPASPAPAAYTLTEAGGKLAPRPASHRYTAWQVVRAHAGKPGGYAAAVAAINAKAGIGSITGRNMLGWALKAGLIARA